MGKLSNYKAGLDALMQERAPEPPPGPSERQVDNTLLRKELARLADRMEKAIQQTPHAETTDVKPIAAAVDKLREALTYWSASAEGAQKDAAQSFSDSVEKLADAQVKSNETIARQMGDLAKAQQRAAQATAEALGKIAAQPVSQEPAPFQPIEYDIKRDQETGLMTKVITRPAPATDEGGISVE